MRIRLIFPLILGGGLAMWGCSDDNPTSPAPVTPTMAMTSVVRLDFAGLQPLANGFHYEGWAIVSGSPLTTGKFNVNSSGALTDLNGAAIPDGEFNVSSDVSNASAVVITIEPPGDTDTTPAATKYLGGDVSSSGATLTTAHASSLGSDFASATGRLILATPTNGSGNNELSGVWFLSLRGGGPGPGLSLPSLPDGWAYEGWSVISGTPVSTGTFLDTTTVDNDAPFSGSQSGPPFPGEDFLRNAPSGLTFPTNLAGTTAVISIEPSPDDSAAPFTLKPLVGMIPGDARDHFTYSMDNAAGAFPTGTAAIR